MNLIKWVEDHIGFLFILLCLVVVVELGIWCVGMPREFKSSIVPKMNDAVREMANVATYEYRFDKKIDKIKQRNKYIHKRVDLLMALERQRCLFRE